jgi:hypothetical protein
MRAAASLAIARMRSSELFPDDAVDDAAERGDVSVGAMVGF